MNNVVLVKERVSIKRDLSTLRRKSACRPKFRATKEILDDGVHRSQVMIDKFKTSGKMPTYS